MAKPLIFDTTPLIYMIKVSLAEQLRRLTNSKVLPQSVYNELLRGEPLGKPEASVVRELVERNAISIARPTNVALVQRLVRIAAKDEKKPLHAAEADALALAKELGGIVISDDHVARSTARLIHVELHGTGYVLGRMAQEGCISIEEAKTRVIDMRRAGWRLSEDDHRTILDYLAKL